jgi:predicted dehydrogenase
MNRREFLSVVGGAGTSLALAAPVPAQAAAPAPRIRIGQIGTVHAHAAGKLAAIRNLPQQFELVGVVEPDAQRRAAVAKDKAYDGVPWVTEEQLFNTRGLQVVDVETEVCDLLATGMRCVAAGMHLHLDKPAGESLPAFKRLLDEAARRKLTVQMGYMFRYNPAFQLCYQAVRDGWLGELFSVDAVIGKVVGAAERKPYLKYPGGAMFELGCHVMDSVIRLLGKPSQITAHNQSSSRLGDGLADNQLAVLEYPKATATVRANFVEVEGGARRQFVVCGDRGTLDIRPLEPPFVRLALDQPRGAFKKGYQDIPLPRTPRYDAEFVDLAKVVRGEKAFEWPPAHDLAVQEAVLRGSGLKVT